MTISQYFSTNEFKLQQLVTPNIGNKNLLFGFRLLAYAFVLFGFFLSLYNYFFNFNDIISIKSYFPYFTNQTYIAIVIYFTLSIYFQIKDRKNALPKRFKNENINILIHTFYNALVPLSFMVTLVFWFLIFPVLNTSKYNLLNYVNQIMLHLFQSIFIGSDWFLINLPTSIRHTIPMVTIGALYLVFAMIYHALYGMWIYPFLNTSNKHWLLVYIGVCSFWIIFGACFTFIHEKKNKLFSKNLNNKKKSK